LSDTRPSSWSGPSRSTCASSRTNWEAERRAASWSSIDWRSRPTARTQAGSTPPSAPRVPGGRRLGGTGSKRRRTSPRFTASSRRSVSRTRPPARSSGPVRRGRACDARGHTIGSSPDRRGGRGRACRPGRFPPRRPHVAADSSSVAGGTTSVRSTSRRWLRRAG
jgi:hypothetical protein